MKIIKLTKGKEVIVDNDIFKKYGHLKWHVRQKKGKFHARRVPNTYLHYLVLGRPPLDERAKFLNGNTLDCRRANLRYIPIKHNSEYRGVTVSYNARIEYEGIAYSKQFSSEKAAALWYNKKAKEFFGSKAKLNIIK